MGEKCRLLDEMLYELPVRVVFSDNSIVTKAEKVKDDRLGRSDVLLAVFHCLTDPESFEECFDLLGNWLDLDDFTPAKLLQFEKHLPKIYKIFEHNLDLMDQTEETVLEEIELITLKAITHADDLARLTRHLRPDTDAQTADICLIRVQLETDKRTALLRIDHKNSPTTAMIEILHSDVNEFTRHLFHRDFGVSWSELLIIRFLVQGYSLSEIAQETGKAIETLRSQLKSAMSKMGVNNQNNLLLRSLEIERATSLRGKHPVPMLDGETFITVEGGRKLFFETYGPKSGTPLLYIHCMHGGRYFSKRAAAMAQAANFRVISMSRAGFGDSRTTNKKGWPLMMSHVADYVQMIDALGISSCAVLGHTTGFSIGFQLALTHPERITDLYGIDILPPILNRADAKLCRHVYQTAMMTALVMPSALRMLSVLGYRRFVGGKMDPTSPFLFPGVDLTKVSSRDSIETLYRNWSAGYAQKGEVTWQEATWFSKDWAQTAQNDNRIPPTTIMSSQDHPLISQELGRKFANRYGFEFGSVESSFPYLEAFLPKIFDAMQAGPVAR